jgi:hypothetical protein
LRPTTRVPRKARSPRQGMRKRDKHGFCSGCGHMGVFRCAKCERWRCIHCIQLRAVPMTIGLYRLTCFARCNLRRSPEVLAVIERNLT